MKPDSPRSAGQLPPRPQQRKVFDVMRPGRAPASSTSKPVIVGHKPMVRDDSVTVQGVGASGRRPLMSGAKRVSLQPVSGTVPVSPSPKPLAPAPVPAPSPKPESTLPSVHVPAAQPVTPAPAPPKTSATASSSAAAPVTPSLAASPISAPAVASVPDARSPQSAPSVPEEVLLEDIQPLVNDEHQHVVSRKVGHGDFPWRNTILIGIILILTLILLNILVDAEFLNVNIPHTDIL